MKNEILKKLNIDTFYKVRKVVIIFYTVGFLGMLVPYSQPLFQMLTPFALIFSFMLLAFYHESKFERKSLLVFAFIFISSFLIEAIGVETAAIFGSYKYGKGLGLKIFDTPLIIGLNWLFLVYTSTSIFEKVKINNSIKILLSSLTMILYDLVLEQVAPKIDMWSWKDNIVPLNNFIAWFALALIFNSLMKIFKIKTKNKLSLILLSVQFVFFVLLFLFL